MFKEHCLFTSHFFKQISINSPFIGTNIIDIFKTVNASLELGPTPELMQLDYGDNKDETTSVFSPI